MTKRDLSQKRKVGLTCEIEVRATHHINSIKDKRHTVIAIDTEKHLILLKTLNKLRREGNFFNIIKAFTKNIGLASYLMIKA